MQSELQTAVVLQRDVADSNAPAIKVTHLTKKFVKGGFAPAVNDVSFEVRNEIISLLVPRVAVRQRFLGALQVLKDLTPAK